MEKLELSEVESKVCTDFAAVWRRFADAAGAGNKTHPWLFDNKADNSLRTRFEGILFGVLQRELGTANNIQRAHRKAFGKNQDGKDRADEIGNLAEISENRPFDAEKLGSSTGDQGQVLSIHLTFAPGWWAETHSRHKAYLDFGLLRGNKVQEKKGKVGSAEVQAAGQFFASQFQDFDGPAAITSDSASSWIAVRLDQFGPDEFGKDPSAVLSRVVDKWTRARKVVESMHTRDEGVELRGILESLGFGPDAAKNAKASGVPNSAEPSDQVGETLNITKNPPTPPHIAALRQFRAIILEGVPGTGKTFAFGQLADSWRKPNDSTHRITFHPASAYEDFVEGVRPNGPTDGLLVEIAGIKVLFDEKGESKIETIWNFWHNKPAPEKPAETKISTGWSTHDGFFLHACAEAVAKPDTDFLVLIDEINRANVPRVLGDLLTTLEWSKRAKWKDDAWQVSDYVTLPLSGRRFFVPDNIYVIGTMNTSDRSVTPLDVALRRRFAFVRLEPIGFDIEKSTIERETTIKSRLGVEADPPGLWNATIAAYVALNEKLLAALGSDAMIGHIYLFDIRDALKAGDADQDGIFKRVWRHFLVPQFIEMVKSAGEEKKWFGGHGSDKEENPLIPKLVKDSPFEGLEVKVRAASGCTIRRLGEGYMASEVILDWPITNPTAGVAVEPPKNADTPA